MTTGGRWHRMLWFRPHGVLTTLRHMAPVISRVHGCVPQVNGMIGINAPFSLPVEAIVRHVVSARPERMTMPDYLEATAFAVERVIEAVWYERDEFEQSRGFVRQEVDDNTWNAFLAASMSGDEDQFWSTYSGLGVSQLSANNALAVLAVTHRLSAAALASALLQIAKQGVSSVHGGPVSPVGRLIGTQNVSVVIWQARNQAMHWDSGEAHTPMEICFATLARDMDPKYGEYRKRSLAFDVVELLGWRTVDAFDSDLGSLG